MSQSQAGTQDKEMDGDGYMDSIIKHYVAHWHSKFDMNMIMFICQSAVGGRQHCSRIVTCCQCQCFATPGRGHTMAHLHKVLCLFPVRFYKISIFICLKDVIKIGWPVLSTIYAIFYWHESVPWSHLFCYLHLFYVLHTSTIFSQISNILYININVKTWLFCTLPCPPI